MGQDPLLGTVIGRWRVERLLGAGGMGRVYEAVQPEIGGRVAIKVLRRESVDDPGLVERFFNEARAVNLIRHENLVDIIDLARLPDGSPYIVMEFLDGASLATVFRRQGKIAPGTLARIVGEVLAALDAAHAKGIIHRDLKPDNVFVSPGGRVTVLDFGIAKLARDDGAMTTQTGALLGTPAYMAPEQARTQPVDARADLYAAGVILYEGATGAPPFSAANLFDLLRLHVEAEPAPPRTRNPELPAAFEAVILRALAKDPAARFASAAEMRAALAAAAEGLPAPELAIGDGAGAARGAPSDPYAATAASGKHATTQASLARGETMAKASEPAPERPAGARVSRGTIAAIVLGAGIVAAGAAVIAVKLAAPGAYVDPVPRGEREATRQPRPQPAPQPQPTPEPKPQPQPQPEPPPKPAPKPQPKPEQKGVELTKSKDGYWLLPLDVHGFRPLHAYAQVRAKAAALAGAPVDIYNLQIDKVDHQGHLMPGGKANYQFISEQAARAGRHCLYLITVTTTRATVDMTDFEGQPCTADPIGDPRCSFEDMVRFAGMADGTDPITISHSLEDEWDLSSGGRTSAVTCEHGTPP